MLFQQYVRRFACLFVAIISLLFSGSVLAVPLSIERLTLKDGLSQSTVYSVIQDQKGYLWFATADGIDIYDGHYFKQLRHDPKTPNSLSDNYVRVLLADRDGSIWVGTYGGGLNRYFPETGEWQQFRAGNAENSLLNNDVHSLYQDRNGDIWIGSDTGVSRLKNNTDRIEHFRNDRPDAAIVKGTIRAIAQSTDGRLWFGSARDGLSVFNPETGEFHQYRHDTNDAGSLSNNAINVIFEDSQQRIWVGTEYGGLNQLLADEEGFRHWLGNDNSEGLNDTEVTSIHEDKEGRLWLGTWSGGINLFDPKQEKFQYYQSSEANQSSLSSNTIISLFEDSSGVLWAGSYDNGVNRIPYQGQDFLHYRYDPLLNTGLANKMIWSFAEAQQKVWVGTKKGLSWLAFDAKGQPQSLHSSRCNSQLESKDIRSIVATKEGTLWLGTAGAGLIQFQPETCAARYFDTTQGLSHNHARLLLLDGDDTLWIGTKQGLNRMSLNDRHIVQFSADRSDPSALPHDRIRALYKDTQGQIWVGTSGGLSRYDETADQFVTLTKADGLSGNDVRSVYEDPQGILWIATGSGLSRYDVVSGEIQVFREQEGLSNNTLYSIMPDGDSIWLTSNNGLNRFDTQTYAVDKFDLTDGLQSNEFNFNAYLKTSWNGFLVGGVNGFNYFDPVVFGSLKTEPVLNLSIAIEDQEGLLRQLASESQNILVNDADRSLLLSVDVLHFLNPSKNGYRYRLKGYDGHWQDSTADNHQLRYAGLPAGDYQFEVQAIASTGEVSESVKTLMIKVLPSPWLTGWAVLGYLLGIIGLMWLLLRLKTAVYRRQQIRLQNIIAENTLELDQQNRQLNEQAGTLQRLLSAQDDFYLRTAHELRTPLSLIRAPAELLSNEQSSTVTVSHSQVILQGVQRLQRLIDQMLTAAINQKVHAPDSQTFDLRAYIQPLISAYRIRAAEKYLRLQISDIPEAALTLDKSALGDILHNLIANAIKYTPEQGTVSVRIEIDKQHLLINVEDSGIGIGADELEAIFQRYYRSENAREYANEGEGIGLDTVKQRVDSCEGSIEVNSQPGQGSRFSVRLPCLISPETTEHMPVSEPVPTEPTADSEGLPLILVIEDDPTMQKLLVDLLQTDYQVRFTASAIQGVEWAQSDIPQLILCDIMLPDGDGLAVTAQLKTETETSHIPIIQLTALGDQSSKLAGLQSSADDYVVKPFSPDELRLRIRSQIENRQRQVEWCRRQILFGRDASEQKGSASIQSQDLQYLNRLESETLVLLSEHNCSLDNLSEAMAQSRRTLQRKLNSLLDCSYTEYIQSVQLKKARQLLQQGTSVKESAFLAGFSDPTHLNRLFKKHYEMTPGEYKRQQESVSTRQSPV